MTRFESIRAHLVEHGPATTKQIAAAFGWRNNTASAAISHARSYGYIEVAGIIPAGGPHGRCPQFIWGPK